MNLRILFSGLLAVAAAAMSFAASVQATTVATTTGGAAATPTIHAANENGHVKLTNPIATIECGSTFEATVESHGSGVTAAGKLSSLSFTGCTNSWHATVTANGSFELHFTSGHNGTLTSSGAKLSATRFGVTCNYETNNTSIGTVTGGNPATLHIEATVAIVAGSSFLCGSSAKWEGAYSMTSALYVAASGGSSPTATTLATSLSGEGKSGEEITVNEGSKVKDTATLSGTNASKATGTVKYKVFADKECKELVTSAGEVEVEEGKVPDSNEVELTAGAVYYWQAEYSGDSNNLASTSTCSKEVLTIKANTSLTTSLSGEEQSSPEIEVKEEVAVTDKATLSGTNVSKAGGNVEYKVYSDPECKTLVTEAGKVTVSGGSVPSSNEVKLTGGLYYWQAVYSGDATHLGSSGICGDEVEAVTEPTSLTTSLWSEEESGKEIEVPEGEPVHDTAALSGTNASEASGTAEYKVYADSECKELVVDAGKAAVSEGEVDPSESVILPAGTYYWQATYSGDSLNRWSTSACGVEVLRVEKDPLTTSLAGEEQSGPEIEVAEETPVTDQATLNTENAASATGTVKYKVYADDECEELVAEAGGGAVIAGVIPASSAVTLPAGVYYWQAVYSGDLTHPEATSVCGLEVLAVAADTSISTSLSGESKSGKEITVKEGAGVSDNATLSGANASEATGVAQYKVYADNKCEELVAYAGSVEVSGATIPKSEEMFLAAGTYYWQVTYYGDGLNQGSTSACDEILQVNTASLTLELTGGGEEGVEIEVPEGTSVTGDATLNTESAATATGTVEYKIYSDAECKELVTEAGGGTVTAGSIPSSTAKTLPEGVYYWQAKYSGDESHPPATSLCGKAVAQVKGTWIVSVGDSYISGEGGRWAGNVANNAEWEKIDAHESNAYKNPENGEKGAEAIEGCHRSTAAEIFIKLPAVRSKNLACSGAETASSSTGTIVAYSKLLKKRVVLKKGTYTPGLDFVSAKETTEINRGKGFCGLPVCKGQALLLREFAEERKKAKEGIKMVVVSIGGNDFGFGPMIRACVVAYRFGKECSKQKTQTDRFENANLKAKRELIEKGLNNVGKAMDDAGFKKAEYTILVQDYPSPIPEEAAKFRYLQNAKPKGKPYLRVDPGGCPFMDADAVWANTTGLKKIDETVKKAYEEVNKAGKYSLAFMELETAFNGRRLCETGTTLVGEGEKPKYPTWEAPGAVDETEWINQIRVFTVGTQFYQQESLHPNYWGQLALRSCVRQAYNNGAPKGGTCSIAGKGLTAPAGAPKPGAVPPGKKRPWDWEPNMQLK